MHHFLLAFLLLSATTLASAVDYSTFANQDDNFTITAAELTAANAENGPVLVWLGKVLGVSVYKNKDGITTIEWFCEQHPFYSEPNVPLSEPFAVQPIATGHFVVTLNLPTLTVKEAKKKMVDQLESPAWVLVRGEPVFVRAYKGTKAVFLHSLNAAISDTMKVSYRQ